MQQTADGFGFVSYPATVQSLYGVLTFIIYGDVIKEDLTQNLGARKYVGMVSGLGWVPSDKKK